MSSVACRSPGTARLCGLAIATDLFDSKSWAGEASRHKLERELDNGSNGQ